MGTKLIIVPEDCGVPNDCWTGGTFDNPKNSPLFLTVSVAGISKGDLWNPGDPEPPSGNFVLKQVGGSQWLAYTPVAMINVWMSVGGGMMEARVPYPPPYPFFEDWTGPCQRVGHNDYVDPVTSVYYGGTISILGVS